VPILGLIENMSGFTTPTGETIHIFGQGGGRQEAARHNIPFLGEIPIYPSIREGGDQGRPIVCGAPESSEAKAFLQLAQALRECLP
jgi:ATP-binding protein involved in chromosome partitioning